MNSPDFENVLLDIAKKYSAQGPGYAQETVVLRQAAKQLEIERNLIEEQRLLTAWHSLFQKGILSWGYNIDNPASPFFHLVESDVVSSQ